MTQSMLQRAELYQALGKLNQNVNIYNNIKTYKNFVFSQKR